VSRVELSAEELGDRAQRNRDACDLAASATGLTAADQRRIARAHAMNSLIANNCGANTPPELVPGIRHLAEVAHELFERTVLPIAQRARTESDAAVEAANRILTQASGGIEE
jgi:hypothetical protein